MHNLGFIPIWEGQKGVRLGRRHEGWVFVLGFAQGVFSYFHNASHSHKNKGLMNAFGSSKRIFLV